MVANSEYEVDDGIGGRITNSELLEDKTRIVRHIETSVLYVDKGCPTRTISIIRNKYFVAVIYLDSTIGATDENGI